MSKALWEEVTACGVNVPSIRLNTYHRMVELYLGHYYGKGIPEDIRVERRRKKEKSEQVKKRAAARNFNSHVL
jgi:hypothetical protein